MDKHSAVVFRNVGQLYFPQARVECHYSLSPDHQWSSSDWIGIFEMGWSSIKQYYTYTWALVPEGHVEGTSVDFSAHFHPFYLPRPGAVEYQFVYVDKMGKVCARSRPFTFCAPKPLEELETLKEEQDGEDGEEELLLVVPRAQLLQSRLEECLRKQSNLQEALTEAKQESETEKENSERAKTDWEREREAMKEEITELRDSLRDSCCMLKKVEGKHKDVKYSQENLTAELCKLRSEKTESHQQIRDLEGNIMVLTERELERNQELERLRDRLKKMSSQMKHDEEKRKSLQAEKEAALAEARGLQDRLAAAEHVADGLRRELKELGARQGLAHSELHQARMQVAQLTLQLSEENLSLREERANWALEREAYKHAAEMDKNKLQEVSSEVERKEEWLQEERLEREKLEAELAREKDYNKVLKSDAKRELQELKASLKKGQKGKEEEAVDKQDLVDYIRQLEQKLGIFSEPQSNTTPAASDSEETPDASSTAAESVSSPLLRPDGAETHTQSREDTADSQKGEQRQDCERKELILPQLVNPVLSELADSPMW
ncbi:calcium-binding and coiled-coil domain-containing protein 1-like [Salarias fasciatus]|uniref:calcium-binding and coiled-coil domain-containing protein 1-like n=1 Tax=Salarias fasciatus TaxID=181472 RepID=UPI00117681CD|nr:calcium-binding and coiled-coil domain-containing protein 1-like [Salarias fasciatus]